LIEVGIAAANPVAVIDLDKTAESPCGQKTPTY
jgi:hypothetical protein